MTWFEWDFILNLVVMHPSRMEGEQRRLSTTRSYAKCCLKVTRNMAQPSLLLLTIQNKRHWPVLSCLQSDSLECKTLNYIKELKETSTGTVVVQIKAEFSWFFEMHALVANQPSCVPTGLRMLTHQSTHYFYSQEILMTWWAQVSYRNNVRVSQRELRRLYNWMFQARSSSLHP